MSKSLNEKIILRLLLMFGLGMLPIIFKKSVPIKDGLLIYLWNGITNGILDKLLVSSKRISYPIRLMPQFFNINILFDFLLYPITAVGYDQLTQKDNIGKMSLKLFFITLPMILIEYLALSQTKLIKFNKGWTIFHSFLGLYVKTLIDRLLIGWIRKTEQNRESSDPS